MGTTFFSAVPPTTNKEEVPIFENLFTPVTQQSIIINPMCKSLDVVSGYNISAISKGSIAANNAVPVPVPMSLLPYKLYRWTLADSFKEDYVFLNYLLLFVNNNHNQSSSSSSSSSSLFPFDPDTLFERLKHSIPQTFFAEFVYLKKKGELSLRFLEPIDGILDGIVLQSSSISSVVESFATTAT
jgi:hypothetical protein